jgi:PEP-CTERM motif
VKKIMSKLGTFTRLALPIFGALLVVLSSAASSRADGVTFNSPTGTIGLTWTYMLDGFPIVATAFNGGSLFGKNNGVGEQGVGLTGDPSGQHEIYAVPAGTPQDFIQLNLSSLIAAGFTTFEFQMGSTTGGETWQVSACATAGTLCSNVSTLTGMNELLTAAPANLSAADPYLDFSSNKGNVLLGMIAATAPTPEPSSLGLLLAGMLGLAGWSFLRRSRAVQA